MLMDICLSRNPQTVLGQPLLTAGVMNLLVSLRSFRLFLFRKGRSTSQRRSRAAEILLSDDRSEINVVLRIRGGL